jgi:hypothetical protein
LWNIDSTRNHYDRYGRWATITNNATWLHLITTILDCVKKSKHNGFSAAFGIAQTEYRGFSGNSGIAFPNRASADRKSGKSAFARKNL